MADFDPWRTADAAWDVLAARQRPPEWLRERQHERLHALLEHARTHTALHRERLCGLDPATPLAALPVLTRATLMSRFDEATSDPLLTCAGVEAFVRDRARIGMPLLDRYLVWESSGTSGRPGWFVQDAAALAVYDALEALRRPRGARRGAIGGAGEDGGAGPCGDARRVAPGSAWAPGGSGAGGASAAPWSACTPWAPWAPWASWTSWASWASRASGAACAPWATGPPGFDRYAFVGAIDGHFPSQASVQRLRRLNPWLAFALRSFSLLQPLDALVQALNAWSPTVLATYPSAAAMLAAEAERGALRIAPHEVLTGGETLDAAVRARVERAFGCPVADSYGAAEFLAIATECAHGRLHVNADWVILEPVDRRGRAVAPGTLSHTTLLTNLANRVQPLIRYDLGDRIRWHAAPCACGSALPAIDVLGRNDDAIVLAGRDGRGVTLPPLALATVLEEEAGVFDFQLRQRDARTLALRLGGPRAGTRECSERFARCHRVLERYARTQGVDALRLVDEPDARPACGRSGKVQRVIALPTPRARDAPATRPVAPSPSPRPSPLSPPRDPGTARRNPRRRAARRRTPPRRARLTDRRPRRQRPAPRPGSNDCFKRSFDLR